MVSAVLLVHNASPQSIIHFHDTVASKLPAVKGKWSFVFKVFRNNVHSIPPELAATHSTAPDSSFLYTWAPSYLSDSCVALVNKSSVAVFSHVVQEELATPAELAIPNDHLHGGATSGVNDPFDAMLASRMQGLWTQRQHIKGDGGQIYELENGNLVLRTANVSLHGAFRGFVIQMEYAPPAAADSVFRELMAKHGLPEGTLCTSVMDAGRPDAYGDLALQYAETLNF